MSIKSKLKSNLKVLLKKAYPFKTQITINKKWLGNEYGGFYIAPEFVNENSIVYSFGIGEDISFDKEIIELTKCRVYGFDPTPKSIKWVESNQLPKEFIFHKYGIDVKNGDVTFFLPENPDFVSGTAAKTNENRLNTIEVPMKDIKTICNELGHTKIDVLKIDIEGSEYSVIPSILESGIEVKQFLIEFHDRFFKDGFNKNEKLIRELNKAGYKIFAVSDSYMEISFIKM